MENKNIFSDDNFYIRLPMVINVESNLQHTHSREVTDIEYQKINLRLKINDQEIFSY